MLCTSWIFHHRVLSRFTCVWLSATPWFIAHQALLSVESSKQEYRSGLPCCPPGDLPDPGTEPASPCIAGRFFTCWATREAHFTTVDLANYPSLCQSITLGHRTVGGGKTSQRATCGVYCSRHISLAFHYFIHLRVHICFPETICSLWFKLIRADGVKKMMERQYNMVIENTDLHGQEQTGGCQGGGGWERDGAGGPIV